MLSLLLAVAVTQAPPSWKQIDQLADEQKYQASVDLIQKRLDADQKSGDDVDQAKALIKLTQLRMALGGYETAVKELKARPWPKGLIGNSAVQLYYAQALWQYAQWYSWEIRKREKVDTKGVVDLKAWTFEQIYAESNAAFASVWARREQLGAQPVKAFGEWLTPNDYPKGIRGTLRDAVGYLWAEQLANSTGWTADQSGDVYKLRVDDLLANGAAAKWKPDDAALHPLQKMAAVTDDLESWHAKAGEKEAALEARRVRLQLLWSAENDEDARAFLMKDIAARIESAQGLAWSTMLRHLQGTWLQTVGDWVQARQVALKGAEEFPKSVGGQRCRNLVATIEAPDYSLESMQNDSPGKRSLQVSHRNLKQLYFRGYKLDLREAMKAQTSWGVLPNGDDIRRLLARTPDAKWTQELPDTPDYKQHTTWVTPPMKDHALWVVIASVRADFVDGQNRLMGVNLMLTRLGLVVRQTEGRVSAQVLDAETGAPVSGADVELWSQRWNNRYELKREETKPSGADGEVVFEQAGHPQDRNYMVVAHQGSDDALDSQSIGFYASNPQKGTQSLIFTDRSVYRPQQKLLFKVLGYAFNAEHTDLKTQPEQNLTVELVDPNYQVVEKKSLRTNGFGSASGEFTIPTGRLLGAWQLRVSDGKGGFGGNSALRVEEYKRPTFEVGWKDAGQVVRLNAPATLTGEAHYYFGLPVASGQVRYVVKRTPVWPWWWGEWGWAPANTGTRTVASGTAPMKPDGTFEVKFTPEADPKQPKEVSYSYSIEADVTDDGGETRSANKHTQVGFVSVQGSVNLERQVWQEGEKVAGSMVRSDLDGNPRAGKGSFKIFALQQPAAVVLPADEPVIRSPQEKPGTFHTPGDSLRPRWSGWGGWNSTVHQWAQGAQVAAGEVDHDAKGQAKLDAGALKAGAYRIAYETKDEAGQVAKVQQDFLVAGPALSLKLPGVLSTSSGQLEVGQTLKVVAGTGFDAQVAFLDTYRNGKRIERRKLSTGEQAFIDRPIKAEDRGGFVIDLVLVRDHQLVHLSQSVSVPWDDKKLDLEFSTFRDLMRPGANETFKVTVKSHGKPVEANAAEVLAYMYDKSLDVFAPHNPPSVLGLYPSRATSPWLRSSFIVTNAQWLSQHDWYQLPGFPSLNEDRLVFPSGYGIGGMGRGGGGLRNVMSKHAAPGGPMPAPPPAQPVGGTAAGELGFADATTEASPSPDLARREPEKKAKGKAEYKSDDGSRSDEAQQASVQVRSDFSETAFFKPHLITDGSGSVSIEFTVPDSVTSYHVWAHAATRAMAGGSVQQETRAVKELMVRPYLPRFLREGDVATLKVLVNNASAKDLTGELKLEVLDPETEKPVSAELLLSPAAPQAFSVKPNQGATLTFSVTAPKRVGLVAFKVVAKAGDLSDGELRPVPLLPSRMHLAQSKFVTLRDVSKRTMTFDDLAKGGDPTLINEQLVVTVDAQLFFTVLKALPYLQRYPYECTEQTLNRFLSSGIVGSVFRDSPMVAKMAARFAARKTPLEPFDAIDPNRKLQLEESPWLLEAKGGKDPRGNEDFIDMLDPKVVEAEKTSALAKLKKAQQPSGAFPWFPGGPPSPYITLYLVQGLSRAVEFKVDVPKDMVQRAWSYLGNELRGEWFTCMAHDGCWEWITTVNFAASSYPDESWLGGALSQEERQRMLDFSFKHWKQHSPLLKGYLALTLKRAGRDRDAKLVFDSVMDSSKTTQDEGTFWQPEDRAWLWYNDTIESHAFALRTLTELQPKDPRRDGLVQWLLLNKKLNQWKSTRATAEVIYSLTKYMQSEHALGLKEVLDVETGPVKQQFVFEPDQYVGKQQLVVPGPQVTAANATVTVSKQTKGFDFASATWMFSTDKLPPQERGDFFHVTRTYFKRVQQGKQMVLQPLADGAKLEPGDELEVQLSIRAKQAAEYVHVRDPRGAGFEPENPVSRYKWELGLAWYEEFRDSATNFFFEQVPPGEYTLKYRVRAALGGTFRVGPATLESMYAPEFTAYSSGATLTVATGGK